MKIRTIAIPALVLGLGAVGVLLAASTAEPGVPPTTSRRPQPTAASQKTKIQPALVSLGDYVVEPPDLLLVEVLDALPGRPISGERLVRPDGKISLGFYGEVEVSGLSLPEVKERIIRHLSRYLTDVSLGICELDDEGKPVGRIAPRDSATVFIDVTAYNSKNYYIQGEVAVPGRLPVTGNETILDVINYAGGMTRYADHQRVVLYRRPKKGGPLQALPVDIDQITMGDDPTTNYQILPGDRVVVPRDPKAGATRTDEDAQPARQTPRSKNRPPEYFDRPTNELDPTAAQRTPAPLVRRGDQTSLLHHVEERLNQVESKLDRILDALDKRRP
jgi:polysaccharide export outer membrane protein